AEKKNRQNGCWEVTYPQFCAFCLLVVYKNFFKFSIMPKAGVGVKSNKSSKKSEVKPLREIAFYIRKCYYLTKVQMRSIPSQIADAGTVFVVFACVFPAKRFGTEE
ncbi:MAG: hypothetical protein J6A08_13730, partial [Lachnospiraceae bacterium]|nr:hypothetical protein [Lachnospiraceae bacterium]